MYKYTYLYSHGLGCKTIEISDVATMDCKRVINKSGKEFIYYNVTFRVEKASQVSKIIAHFVKLKWKLNRLFKFTEIE